MEQFITIQKAMKAYGFSRQFFYDLFKQEQLTHYKVNRRVMIDNNELRQLIKEGKQAA